MELDFIGTGEATEESTAANLKQQSPDQLSELAFALDRTGKLLSSSSSIVQSQIACHSLRSVHELIGSVLYRFDGKSKLADRDVPMPEAENGCGGGEEESRNAEEVGEGLRECVLHSKRIKRPPSLAWAAREESSSAVPADALTAAVELVLQFHA